MLKQAQYLGVDIGGTKISIGAVSQDGRILAAENFPTPWGKCENFRRMLRIHLEEFLQSHNELSIIAAGVGFRALVDYYNQRVLSSSIINDAQDFDICECIKSLVSVPVYLDNDVNAMACGELVFGQKKEHSSFIYVNIGTGLGLGIVVDGRLVRGTQCQAGEVTRYLTGKEENLESLISGYGIDKRVREFLPFHPESSLVSKMHHERIPVSDVVSAWRLGDNLASIIMNQGIHELSLAIINMEAVLNCGLYVFGGGVVGDGWIISQIENRIQQISHTANIPFEGNLKLSALGAAQAGLIGAAALCVHEMGEQYDT